MSLVNKRVGFIGAGAMASALMHGIIEKGVLSGEQIFASDIDKNRLTALATELGINAVADNERLIAITDIIVLAVKPQVIFSVLAPLDNWVPEKQLVISIAAGIKLADLEAYLQGMPVIRVMPNTPCLVGAGATGIALGSRASAEHGQLALKLFAAVGEAFILEEKLLDAVTGLSGSGPAYGYLFIEALADGGVREGLPRPVSLRLAAQTVLGAAKMVLDTGKHPGVLKDMVTSPAGTTIAGIGVLEERAFRGTVMDAVRIAAEKSRAMAGKKE
ncbi:MAG: pyrroline-5-carboxylate reductase [bacterium]